ncbi:MAG: outer membrane protein assembly factor BamB [Pseudomonadota bacterium]
MTRRLLAFPLLLALAACSGKDDLIEPSPLPDIASSVKFDRDWSADAGRGSEAEGLALVPAVTGQAVYTADQYGHLAARDRRSGKRLWKRSTREPFAAGPAAGYNQIFVGTREGEVLAYSATDGTPLWRTPLGGEVLAVPALNGDAVAVKTADGRVTLLDRVSGSVRWTWDGGAPPLSLRASSSPLLLDDAVLAGLPSGMLVALERATGQLIWERRIAEPSGKSELDRLVDVAGDFVLRDDRIYVATYQGRLVALDLRSGQFLWQQPVSTFQPLAVSADAVFVTDADSRLIAVRAVDGVVLWRLESLLGRRVTGAALLGDWLLVGDLDGWLHVIRQADGVLVGRRKIDGDGMALPPVVDENRVFALGRGGRLAVFGVVDRRAPAQPAAVAP